MVLGYKMRRDINDLYKRLDEKGINYTKKEKTIKLHNEKVDVIELFDDGTSTYSITKDITWLILEPDPVELQIRSIQWLVNMLATTEKSIEKHVDIE